MKKVIPMSRFICDKLVNTQHSREKIAKLIEKQYPTMKLNGMRAVKYYINFIAIGKMTKIGFPPEGIFDREVTIWKKKVTKKIAKRVKRK